MKHHRVYLTILALLGTILGGTGAVRAGFAGVAASDPQGASLLADLQRTTNGQAQIAYHAETGKVRFVGTDQQHPVAPPSLLPANASPEQTARTYLTTYSALFGIRDQARELNVMHTQTGEHGRNLVRFQQMYRGVPIIGGELIVQSDQRGNMLSMNGEVLPDLQLNIAPTISALSAQQTAISAVSKAYHIRSAELRASQPQLWIFNPALLGGAGLRRNTLVWRMELTAPTADTPIREFVLIDAQHGNVALHFNQIAEAKRRYVCNANNAIDNDGDPNNNCETAAQRVRSEGGPSTGIADVDLAYEYAGLTYDFYYTLFGRDSLDGQGLPLISLVKYCSSANSCPFENAFWNGQQMTYGDNYASADDVVAHELTHGLTEFTAHLFYYYQSGAINESLSDVFGELLDQSDGRGNDAPSVRWQIGEDLPIGAIRDMRNPGAFQNPDTTSSPDYYGDTDDHGGVHTNSGVNNKAAYLMTDGGTFNGHTVVGLGATKVAHIYYEAETKLMTSATDYQDLSDQLQQACRNLVGSYGITAANCQQVTAAVAATEMDQVPLNAQTAKAPMCGAGQYPQDVFFDDFERPQNGTWASSARTGANEWFYPANTTRYGDFTYATSGRNNLWGNDQGGTQDEPLAPADYSIAMTRNVVVPSQAYLHFNHAYGFEADTSDAYDGGMVEYSTNGGTTWQDAGALLINNGYNGTLATGENPLGGREAFVGHSNGYGSSRANLNTLAGRSVRFRFRIGTDSITDDYGWFIDDLRIYTCGTTPPVTPTPPSFTQHVYLPLTKR